MKEKYSKTTLNRQNSTDLVIFLKCLCGCRGRGGSGGLDERRPQEEIRWGQYNVVVMNLALFPADTHLENITSTGVCWKQEG